MVTTLISSGNVVRGLASASNYGARKRVVDAIPPNCSGWNLGYRPFVSTVDSDDDDGNDDGNDDKIGDTAVTVAWITGER